jgi:chromosome segregation ATPase
MSDNQDRAVELWAKQHGLPVIEVNEWIATQRPGSRETREDIADLTAALDAAEQRGRDDGAVRRLAEFKIQNDEIVRCHEVIQSLEAERDEALRMAASAADDTRDYMDMTQRLKQAEAVLRAARAERESLTADRDTLQESRNKLIEVIRHIRAHVAEAEI